MLYSGSVTDKNSQPVGIVESRLTSFVFSLPFTVESPDREDVYHQNREPFILSTLEREVLKVLRSPSHVPTGLLDFRNTSSRQENSKETIKSPLSLFGERQCTGKL